MPYEIVVDADQNFIMVQASGVPRREELETVLQDIIYQPDRKPGLKVLLDFRKLEKHLSSEDVHLLSKWTKKHLSYRGIGRFAAVMPDDLGFGLTRVFHSMTEEEKPLAFSVHRTVEEARKWLGLENKSSD
jgi:hypothetical protein